MDHSGFSLIQALIYILNQVWAPFAAGVSLYVPVPCSLYLLPGTLDGLSCLCLLRGQAYITVCDLSSDEAGSLRFFLQPSKEEVLANV